jgi:hypothetical protein
VCFTQFLCGYPVFIKLQVAEYWKTICKNQQITIKSNTVKTNGG